MSTLFKNIIVFVFLFLSALVYAQQTTFSSHELKEDIQYLKTKLLRYHPNIFVYTTEKEFHIFFEQLIKKVPNSNNDAEAFSLIASVSSLIKDGHTIIYPNDVVLDKFYHAGKLFPFRIFWDTKNMYTVMNFSQNRSIPDGIKILSINDITVDSIFAHCQNGLMKDGHNENYSTWIFNNFFTAYYGFFFGYPESFKIVFENKKGKVTTTRIPALTKNERNKIRAEKYPVYHKYLTDEIGKGIQLKIDERSKTATIIIKDFHNDALKSIYQQRFKKEIRAHFKTIKKLEIEHLILDLRGNQGGNLTNGKFLLKHLLNTPFSIVESYAVVDKRSAKNNIYKLKPSNGFIKGTHQPFKDAFKGTFYLLIDGGSFSNSAIVSTVLKRHKRGTIVGEATGGSAYVLAGYPIETVILPNTKIKVEIPTLQFILQKSKNKKGGAVIPNITIRPSITDILNHQDPALQYIQTQISNHLK